MKMIYTRHPVIKLVITFFFVLVVIVALVHCYVFADYSGICGENLTWELNSAGKLTISGNGAMFDYTYDSMPWYNFKSSIYSVDIQRGVTSVGNSSFYDCHNIVNVSLSDTVLSIGDEAFVSCNSLSSITNSPNLISIGQYAFYLCTSLTSIEIPSGVSSIGSGAFICTPLEEIDVSPNNKNYQSDNGVLYEITTKTLIKCPVSFSGSYSIVEGTTNISDDAFYECAYLSEIIIPESVSDFGHGTFYNCSSLSHIVIYSTSSNLDVNSSIFNGCSSITTAGAIGGGYDYEFAWLDIPDSAFSGMRGLRSIEIPNGATIIGDCAFNGCSSLISVSLPDTLEIIGDMAFVRCPFTSISIPASVKTIKSNAFNQCVNLKKIYITDLDAWCKIDFGPNDYYFYANDANPLSNGGELFLNNERITTLTIPETITVVKRYAFFGCKSIEEVVFHASVSHINKLAFNSCQNLTSVSFENPNITIDGYAFAGCSQLTYVNYNGTNKQWNDVNIGVYNDELTSATINISKCLITYYGNGGINVPDPQVKTIGEALILTDAIPVRNGWCFLGWAESFDAVDPEYLPEGNYYGDDDIILYAVWAQPDFILPSELLIIEEETFLNCAFRFVALSENTVEIQREAFANCLNMKYILIPAYNIIIDKNAFNGTENLTILGVPGSVVENYAEEWEFAFVPIQ